jgi:hypothetical protein
VYENNLEVDMFYVKNAKDEYCSEGFETLAQAEVDLLECLIIRPDLEFHVSEEDD